MDRRKFVKIAGVTAAVGATGCIGGGNGNGDDGNGDGGDGNGDGGDGDGDGEEIEYEDMTGQSEVTVDAEETSFNPENIEIDQGTEVTWEWVNVDSGGHNIVHAPGEEQDNTGAEEPMFENPGGIVGEVGHTWSYTFDEPGTYYYICVPHEALGMVGHIRVVEGDGDGTGDGMNGDGMDGNETDGDGMNGDMNGTDGDGGMDGNGSE